MEGRRCGRPRARDGDADEARVSAAVAIAMPRMARVRRASCGSRIASACARRARLASPFLTRT
ncbi:hypothetical protein C6P96_07725 [Burkholderia multivorans]|nr:hypothetical protein C6P95_14065 [Burkholderia multivorans]PRF15594.1 hypothetical protein C6P96_07725 [Burkholderia multivorans]